jgi:hypothetical protein
MIDDMHEIILKIFLTVLTFPCFLAYKNKLRNKLLKIS